MLERLTRRERRKTISKFGASLFRVLAAPAAIRLS